MRLDCYCSCGRSFRVPAREAGGVATCPECLWPVDVPCYVRRETTWEQLRGPIGEGLIIGGIVGMMLAIFYGV